MFIEPYKIIFKQDHQGIFRNKAHNLIIVDGGDVHEWLPVTEIINTDTGATVFSGFYSDAIVALADMLKVEWDDICMLTYTSQKGRRNDMEVKIGPGHLTKGTKIKVNDLPGRRHSEKVLTVKKVNPNGPGSMVVICEETEADPFGKNGELTNIGFHIDFVSAILSRSVDQGPAWDVRGFEPNMTGLDTRVRFNDRPAHGRRFVELGTFLYVLQNFERDNTTMWRRYFDTEKLEKRLRGMGLLRAIQIKSWSWRSRESAVNAYFVDAKRALKFLRKNPHWAFGTIEAARLKDAEYWNEVHSQFDDIIGND